MRLVLALVVVTEVVPRWKQNTFSGSYSNYNIWIDTSNHRRWVLNSRSVSVMFRRSNDLNESESFTCTCSGHTSGWSSHGCSPISRRGGCNNYHRTRIDCMRSSNENDHEYTPTFCPHNICYSTSRHALISEALPFVAFQSHVCHGLPWVSHQSGKRMSHLGELRRMNMAFSPMFSCNYNYLWKRYAWKITASLQIFSERRCINESFWHQPSWSSVFVKL